MTINSTVKDVSPIPITIVRIPGAKGPILRCQGHLTVETAEVLRRDLMLLASAGHAHIIVNLNGVRKIDSDGVLALVETAQRFPACSIVLVIATEPAQGYIHLSGVDRLLPLFQSESAALSVPFGSAS
jgi:anti-anti-sigma factor